MALANSLGVDKTTYVGKLTDAQVAMTDTDLTANLETAFAAELVKNSVQVKAGETASILYNRALRKFKASALTEAA